MPKKKGKKKGEGPDLEAGGEKGELRKAQYITQSLQASVGSLKGRVKGLESENDTLRQSRMRVSKETHDFVKYFQGELEKRDSAVDDLKSRLRTSEMARASETAELRAELRRVKDEGEAVLKREKERLETDLAETREQLSRLEEYRMNKTRVDAEVNALQNALAEEKVGRKREVQETERSLLLRQSEMVDRHKAEYEEMKRRARREAQARLDEDIKRLVVQNRRYAEELSFHRQQNKVLSAEVAALREANRSFAREIEMAADAEKVYAERATRRRKETRSLRDRLQGMERSMADMAREVDRTSIAGGSKEDGERANLEEENEAIKVLLKRKNRELRTVRKLAEIVLSQRSEAEQLVLDSLTEVKRQVRDRKLLESQSHRVPALPSLRPRAPTSSPMRGSVRSLLRSGAEGPSSAARAFQELLQGGQPKPAHIPMPKLSDLDPEDRMAVLETLFDKLRKGQAPGGVRLPLTDDVGLASDTGPEYGGIGAPFGLAMQNESISSIHSPPQNRAQSLVAALAQEVGLE